jgi:hypothetical protein
MPSFVGLWTPALYSKTTDNSDHSCRLVVLVLVLYGKNKAKADMLGNSGKNDPASKHD